MAKTHSHTVRVSSSLVASTLVSITAQQNMKLELYSLKGHCHAIWQLYKKLEGVFASIEFQN